MPVLDTAEIRRTAPLSVTQYLWAGRGTPPAEVLTPVEESATPGLVVAPRLQYGYTGVWSFTGTWTVLHRNSGYPVVVAGPTGLGHARDLAALLGDQDIDWTQDRDRLPLKDYDVRCAVDEVRTQVEAAVQQARPARLVRSWQEASAAHWVGEPDNGADAFFGTFDEAADFVLENELHDNVVGTDDLSWWHLLCAAVDCRDELDEFVLPHRKDAADAARGEGWRRIDQKHWLCPSCTPLFTPSGRF